MRQKLGFFYLIRKTNSLFLLGFYLAKTFHGIKTFVAVIINLEYDMFFTGLSFLLEPQSIWMAQLYMKQLLPFS